MWNGKAHSFDALREQIETLPVIDTHEHWGAVCPLDDQLDILALFADSAYYQSDLFSASMDFSSRVPVGCFPASPLAEYMADMRIPFESRYDAWRKYHDRTCHTAYSRALFEGLRVCWGMQSIEMSDLLAAQERMRTERHQEYVDSLLSRHGVQAMIVDTDLCGVMAGKLPYRAGFAHFMLALPQYHQLFTEAMVRKPHLEAALGRKIVILDDYLEAFESFLREAISFGIIGFKDQTAYRRCIDYGHPSRAQAEIIFNKLISQPRDTFGTEEVRPLDDFLFNHFMRLAARYQLPVQVHTGHMAGIRNEIMKTNPAHLTSVLELHADVTFDLFHGGWPFIGEFLFLGKNYPNVNLDMCWANIIDPVYSVEFFERALMTAPHNKISGYGGDTFFIEMQIGSLLLARDNIAAALAEMVDAGWLGEQAALTVARSWLHENPAAIFRLAGVDSLAEPASR